MKNFIRTFNSEMYSKTVWLCGSETLCKLFCWPCLLLGKDKSPWNSKDRGYSDLNNLHTAISRHEKSESHIHAWIALGTFGKSRIDLLLDEQKRANIVKHNETVKQNREVLKRLTAATCFLGQQELAFRGHNESSDSNNRGNYVELIHLLAEFDDKLRAHLATATVFTGLSPIIQNDLIQSVHGVMLAEIKSQIKEATFVAILLDETSDVTNRSQLSTVFRYVYKGQIFERFVGFSDVSADRSADSLAKLALQQFTLYECEEKVVAQTYDGAAVMAGHLNGVQAKVREVIPQAIFVHCYAHKLNLVLSQAVSGIKACRVFFANLSGFVTFFGHSSKRTNLLDNIVKKRFPKLAPTRWSYSSRLVQTVADYRTELEELYEYILENPEDWDTSAINEARGFLMMLRDFQFNFLLCLFQELFSLTDVTYNIVQAKSLDIAFCSKEVESLQEKLQTKRNNGFEKMWSKAENIAEPPIKRRKGNDTQIAVQDDYKRMYFEIIDTIVMQINVRFNSLSELKFIEIFDTKKFKTFADAFPEELFQKVKTLYGKYFDTVRLKSELSAMFTSDHLKAKTVQEMQRFLYENELQTGLPELYKFCELVLTIPATSSSVERSFSALKRIKSFARNAQGQSRLSALSIMSIEKDLLIHMKAKTTFFDEVTEEFCKKNRRAEFHYK